MSFQKTLLYIPNSISSSNDVEIQDDTTTTTKNCIPLYIPSKDDINRSNFQPMEEILLHYNNNLLYKRAYHSLFYHSDDDDVDDDDSGNSINDNTKCKVTVLKQPLINISNNNDNDNNNNNNNQDQEPVVIYAHQREVIHASNLQYEHNKSGIILTSDDATTCHILALRSYNGKISCDDTTCTDNNHNIILGSLCHLDSIDKYKSCIESIFKKHLSFHQNNISNSSKSVNNNKRITMELHIVGGYNNNSSKHHTSIEMTTQLLLLLNSIAIQYQSVMDCILKTCIVSPLNDIVSYTTTGRTSTSVSSSLTIVTENQITPSPIVRGLAINVHTGVIQLINKVHSCLRGPESTLRRIRLWSSSSTHRNQIQQHSFNSLMEIHSYSQERIFILPFEFKPFNGLKYLSQLPDEDLLSWCSTSPDVEDDDFCNSLRESFQFLMNVSVNSVFEYKDNDGNGMKRKPLIYEYDGHNVWKRVL